MKRILVFLTVFLVLTMAFVSCAIDKDEMIETTEQTTVDVTVEDVDSSEPEEESEVEITKEETTEEPTTEEVTTEEVTTEEPTTEEVTTEEETTEEETTEEETTEEETTEEETTEEETTEEELPPEPPVCNHVWNDGVITTSPTCTQKGVKTFTCQNDASHTYTEEVRELGHNAGEAVVENNVDPDCVNDGSYDNVVYCTREECRAEISRETATVGALGHSEGEAVVENNVDPDCVNDGSYDNVVYCAREECRAEISRETATVGALGHSEGEAVVENNVDPDCVNDGSYDNVVYCTVCGEEISREAVVVEALGHNYESVATAPTCTEGGYTTYTCSVCGDTYVDDEVEALGHTEGDVVVENNVDPDCVNDGSYDNVVYCTVCGEEISRETITVDALGHDYDAVVTAPSCTEAGYTTYTCKVCGDTYVADEIDALGHTEGDVVVENNVDPDCINNGSYDNVVYCTVCGEEIGRETVVVEALGHNYESVVTAPTCTEGGYTTYTCSVCGDTYVDDEVEALGHTDGEAVVENNVAPDCVNDGSYDNVVYCTVCGDELSRETITVDALGHNYDAVVTDPTCTEGGYTTYTCSVCGDTYVDDEVEALGHTEGEAVVENNVDPDCVNDGSYDKVVYCTVCGEEISRETVVVEALGHNYESVVTAPTCTEGGYTTYTCSVCGDTYVDDEVEALGHTDGEAVVENNVDPDCVNDGRYNNVVYCTVCGEELSRETITVDALGHDYDAVVTAPSCTEAGYTTYTCKVCGDTYVADEIDALGHTEGEAVVENNVAPDCVNDGSYDNVVYCTVCGEELSRETITVDALGHDYDSVVTAPTCTEDGYTTYRCAKCDDIYMGDKVDAFGHTEVVDAAVEATCTETGLTEGKHCSVCNKVLVAQTLINAFGHEYYGVVTAPTCTEAGYMTYTCSICGDNHKSNYVDALGHTEGEVVVENNVDPTCTEKGSYDNVVYCAVCGEELSREAKTVEALGHNYVGSETKKPTCTATGIMTYVCQNDQSHVYTEEIDMVSHTEVEIPAVESTCYAAGSTAGVKCSACGTIITAPEATAKKAHTFEHGVCTVPECGAVCEHNFVEGTCTICGIAKSESCTHKTTETIYKLAEGSTSCDNGIIIVRCADPYCQEEQSREFGKIDHDLVHVDALAETCTENGYTEHDYCKRCTYTTKEVIPAAHKYEAEITKAADCTNTGVKTYTCSACGDNYTEILAVLGHDLTNHEAKAATCTEIGWNAYVTCDRDGCDYTTYKEIAALGHDYESVVTAPTCTTAGYTTYTCANCGDTYIADEVAALGHDYEAVVTAPTCTEGGYTTYTCNVCGDTYVADEVDALGHKYEAVVTAPTCTEGGFTTYTCACGYTYVDDVVGALGHDYKAAVTAPTCTTAGYTTYTCACGDTYVADEVAALGHTEGEAVVENEKAPTCTADGSYDNVVYCAVCGDELSRETITVDALGHNFTNVIEAGIEPTCKTEGKVAVVACTRCDHTEGGEVVPKLGHNWVVTTSPLLKECSRCDASLTEAGQKDIYTGNNYIVDSEIKIDGTIDDNYVCITPNGATITYVDETFGNGGHESSAKEMNVIADPSTTNSAVKANPEIAEANSANFYVAQDEENVYILVQQSMYGSSKSQTYTVDGLTYAPYTEIFANLRLGFNPKDYTQQINFFSKGYFNKTSYDGITYAGSYPKNPLIVHGLGDANGFTKKIGTATDIIKDYTDASNNPLDSIMVRSASGNVITRTYEMKLNKAAIAAEYKAVFGSETEVDFRFMFISLSTSDYVWANNKNNSSLSWITGTVIGSEAAAADGLTSYIPDLVIFGARCPGEGKTHTVDNCEATKLFEQTASCAQDGFVQYKCNDCGEIFYKDYVNAFGHNLTNVIEAGIEPTCKTEGKAAVMSCTRCNRNVGGEVIPKLGHDWVATTSPIVNECSRCDASLTELGQKAYYTGDKYTSNTVTLDGSITDADGYVSVTPNGSDIVFVDQGFADGNKASGTAMVQTDPDTTVHTHADSITEKFYVAQDENYVYIAIEQVMDQATYTVNGITYQTRSEDKMNLRLGFNPNDYTQQICLYSNGHYITTEAEKEKFGVTYKKNYTAYPFMVIGLADEDNYFTKEGVATDIIENYVDANGAAKDSIAKYSWPKNDPTQPVTRTFELKLSKEAIAAEYADVFGSSVNFGSMYIGMTTNDYMWENNTNNYSLAWANGTVIGSDVAAEQGLTTFIPNLVVFGEKIMGNNCPGGNNEHFAGNCDYTVGETIESTCTRAGGITGKCDWCDTVFIVKRDQLLEHNYVDGICSRCQRSESAWNVPEVADVGFATNVSTAPNLDGVIGDGEYGTAYRVNNSNTSGSDIPSEYMDYYFAYDEENIYIAIYDAGPKYVEDNDGNASNNIAQRNNYKFRFGFDPNDATSFLEFGGYQTHLQSEGNWKILRYYDLGTKKSFDVRSEAEVKSLTTLDLIDECKVTKYRDDTGEVVSTGGLTSGNGNKNYTGSDWSVVIEFKLNKKDVAKLWNKIYYTDYDTISDAMWMTVTTEAYKGSTVTTKWFGSDVTGVANQYEDYGLYNGVTWMPGVIVFANDANNIKVAEMFPSRGEEEPKPTIPEGEGDYKHVVIVGIDGMGAYQTYKMNPATGTTYTPNIESIFGDYALSTVAQSYNPVGSGPLWMSLMTGVDPLVMRTVKNANYEPAKLSNLRYEEAKKKYETLFELFHDKYGDEASIASISTFDAMHELMWPSDDYLYKAGNPATKWTVQEELNNALTYLNTLDTSKPSFTFIYFTRVDSIGHEYGWGSDEYYATLQETDAALGLVYKTMLDKGMTDDNTLLILTTDHGGDGTDHGMTFTPKALNITLGFRGHTINNIKNFDAIFRDVAAVVVDAMNLAPGSKWDNVAVPPVVPTGLFKE